MMRMTLAILSLLAGAAVALPASAATYLPGDPEFQVKTPVGTTIFTANSISAVVGVNTTGDAPGTYTDDFHFALPKSGLGSGSIATTATGTGVTNFINIISVTFDGKAVPGSYDNGALFQFAGTTTPIPITANVFNDLVVTYTTSGTGSYGGNLTFDAAVPEPATWATFLLGFGFMGLALRRKLSGQPKAA